MDTRAINSLPRHPIYREPPKPKRNILRALAIIVAAGVLAGALLIGYQYIADTYFSSGQTVYVQGNDQIIPYPESTQEVADRFGGDPSDWYRTPEGGWVYQGEEPIAFTFRRNVMLYTDHAAVYWE